MFPWRQKPNVEMSYVVFCLSRKENIQQRTIDRFSLHETLGASAS
jgi:hypothetical protein